MVAHALKHTFGQPFHLYRHTKIYEDVQKGKVTSYRQVRNLLCKVISHKSFLSSSINHMGTWMLISGANANPAAEVPQVQVDTTEEEYDVEARRGSSYSVKKYF